MTRQWAKWEKERQEEGANRRAEELIRQGVRVRAGRSPHGEREDGDDGETGKREPAEDGES